MDNAYSDQLDVPILDIGEPQWDFFYLDLKGFTDDHPVSSSLQIPGHTKIVSLIFVYKVVATVNAHI
eukprot:gene17053-20272_t